MIRNTLLGSVLLAAVGLSSLGSAQSPCPNTRASQVDARSYWTGEVVRCGFGIRIFGIGGGLFGPRCGERKVFEPAHQVCDGAENPGTACVPSGTIPLTFEVCHCVNATVFGTGFVLPTCACAPGHGDGGSVEDFQTIPCDPKIEDPPEAGPVWR